MARPKKLRKITNPPKIKGFSPIRPFQGNGSSPVLLDYDEFEALRLSDYELKSLSEAAVEMEKKQKTRLAILLQLVMVAASRLI